MLKVENLNLELDGKSILSNVQFNVEKGEILTIIGTSGSGKTSILKSIVGIHRTSNALIELDGERLDTLPIEKRNTTLVFQEFTLFPHMTVEENMNVATFDSTLHKVVLEKLGVNKHYKKYPHQLSGGEQQRVAIARAIAYRPKLLLLDEPFSNTDAITTETLRPILTDLIKQFGITTIMVTHDIQDVWSMADKVMVVDNGKIVGHDTPEKLYDYPPSLFVAKKMGKVIEHNGFFYRPDQVHIYIDYENYDNYEKSAKIVEKIPFGMYNKIKIEFNDTELILCDNTRSLYVGQTVGIGFNKILEIGDQNND